MRKGPDAMPKVITPGQLLFETIARQRLLSDIRGWDERRGTEEYGGSTWQTFSPGLQQHEKVRWEVAAQAFLADPPLQPAFFHAAVAMAKALREYRMMGRASPPGIHPAICIEAAELLEELVGLRHD
jgi:hypothetical protein